MKYLNQGHLEQLDLIDKNVQQLLKREAKLNQENESLKKKIEQQSGVIEKLNLSLDQLEQKHNSVSVRLDGLIQQIEEQEGIN